MKQDDIKEIFPSIREAKAEKIKKIMNSLSEGQFLDLLQSLRVQTDIKFGKNVKTYVPGDAFPAISTTATRCELNCAHCNHKYLAGMIPAENPIELKQQLFKIANQNNIGALISGGSTKEGVVNLSEFFNVLSEVKNSTSLVLNVHTGLVSQEDALKLYKSKIDTISLDLVGNDTTIQQIYGLNKTVHDYIDVLKGLMDAGFTNHQIIPHICIGLDRGEIKGEYHVLKYLDILDPTLIVFIIIIPPKKNTNNFKLIDPIEAGKVIAAARILYPNAEISLGCMRPGGRLRPDYDLIAFKAGATRIAVPTRSLTRYLETHGYNINKQESCCAIHV